MARRDSRLPARGLRPRRANLRARDREHEGVARLLRRGCAGPAGHGLAATRRRPDRSGLRGDREAQWGDEFRGPEYRGYATGSRHLAAHGGAADLCIIGEPSSQKLVLAHYGAIWMRLSTHGPFVHTAFSEGRQGENSIVRMRAVFDAVLDWIPSWEERGAYGGRRGIVNLGAINGGFAWRLSRTPHRTDLFLDVRVPPSMAMAEARRGNLGRLAERAARAVPRRRNRLGGVRDVAGGGDQGSPAGDSARGRARTRLRRAARTRRNALVLRRSVLTRYGIDTVNYGTSESAAGSGGRRTSTSTRSPGRRSYALAAAEVCGVA